VASAARGFFRAINTKDARMEVHLTCILERGHFVRSGVDGCTHYSSEALIISRRLLCHLLSSLTLGRASGLRLSTNLIVEDCFLEVFEKLRHVFADLHEAIMPRQFLFSG
jgi:hypothetical protein